MITRFRVQNYKALRDVSLQLTPIHVLIGPNDSGKTSVLEALRAIHDLPRGAHVYSFPGRWEGRQLVWRGADEPRVTLEGDLDDGPRTLEYRASFKFAPVGRELQDLSQSGLDERLLSVLGPIQSYRWVPAQLALPVAFQTESRFAMGPSGFGLALFLADILGYDRELYGGLVQRFQTLFPYIENVRLFREQGFKSANDSDPLSAGYGIYFALTDGGAALPASQASDGLLLALAYLAILYSPEPPRLLLIEEPENGIHPNRLKDVLRILKELVREQDRTQVVLTTHSPYVVDLFQPEEVTLCLKGADGAVTAHRLSESKAVREQRDIFQLGEIWTAEGDEALAAPVGQG